MLIYLDFKGKTIVVIGASAGLGQRIAQRFLEASGRFILICRSELKQLTDTERVNREHIQRVIRDNKPVKNWLSE